MQIAHALSLAGKEERPNEKILLAFLYALWGQGACQANMDRIAEEDEARHVEYGGNPEDGWGLIAYNDALDVRKELERISVEEARVWRKKELQAVIGWVIGGMNGSLSRDGEA